MTDEKRKCICMCTSGLHTLPFILCIYSPCAEVSDDDLSLHVDSLSVMAITGSCILHTYVLIRCKKNALLNSSFSVELKQILFTLFDSMIHCSDHIYRRAVLVIKN